MTGKTRSLFQRSVKSTFIRNFLVMASGTAFAQTLPVMAMPVLSRLFTPEEFGLLGLFTAFIAVASAAVSLSFQLAIVSDISDRDASRLAILAFLPIFPVSLIMIAGLILLMETETLGFQSFSIRDVFWAWLALVSIGVFSVFRYWQVREEAFGKVSRATVSQSIGRVVGQLTTGVLGVGGSGLLFAEALGRTFGVTMLVRSGIGRIRRLSAGTSAYEYRELASDFRKFPLLNVPSSVLNTLGTSLLIPLIAGTYGLTLSGQFSMGYRVLTLPLAVIGAAVADVFHVQLVKSAKLGMEHARRLFLKVSLSLLALGLLPSTVMIVWGEQIFSFALGTQWAQAGAIAAGLMPWLLCSFAISPVSRVVMVFRGQEWKLIYDILNVIGVVGVVRVGAYFDWPILQTARTLGITQAFAYLVYFLLLWRILTTRSRADALDKR